MSAVPTADELRALAALQGVAPTAEDLEAVRGFLEGLLPAFAELERLIPADTVPAGLS